MKIGTIAIRSDTSGYPQIREYRIWMVIQPAHFATFSIMREIWGAGYASTVIRRRGL